MSKAEFRASNPSAEQYVAFKVLTTDPRRYAVHPNYGVVAPKACTTVFVEIQPLRNEAAAKAFISTKQKFMIQWRALTGTPDLTETAHVLVSDQKWNQSAPFFNFAFPLHSTPKPPLQ